MTNSSCSLCAFGELQPSWLEVEFNGKNFRFNECVKCRSLICDPMPDRNDLARMYNDSYCDDPSEQQFEDLAKFNEVLEFLKHEKPGRFIDFGCGDGRLLRAVKALGWDVLGIDFNPTFAAALADEGVRVIGHNETTDEPADVVHLGDVLEHLTEMDDEFPRILNLVKPGGALIAHGPLEANPNLFFRLIRFRRKFAREPNRTPPYHVLLATTLGQRALFERHRLVEEEFRVREIAFPAPESFPGDNHGRMLYFCRKVSQMHSKRNIEVLGNRFFYIGQKRDADLPV